MDFNKMLIDEFEKSYWPISDETKEMLLNQTTHQLIAKLAEWIEWHRVKGVLKF